jgi:hypothetical protein
MNRFLTIAGSGLIATGLAILPIAAFAQTAPVTTTAPAMTTTTVPAKTASSTMQTATTPAPAGTVKSDTKTPVQGAKTQLHGSSTVKTPAAGVQTKG